MREPTSLAKDSRPDDSPIVQDGDGVVDCGLKPLCSAC
jgi:hypothetical protein